MYFVISLSRSDSTEPHSPTDLLPMSPSVYAVLRENLSPTTIETAVCSLSFPLLVRGTPNEANVVPVTQKGSSSAWEVRKHICWNNSMCITLGVSVCCCGSLTLWALKADTFPRLNCFMFFPSKATKGWSIPVPHSCSLCLYFHHWPLVNIYFSSRITNSNSSWLIVTYISLQVVYELQSIAA